MVPLARHTAWPLGPKWIGFSDLLTDSLATFICASERPGGPGCVQIWPRPLSDLSRPQALFVHRRGTREKLRHLEKKVVCRSHIFFKMAGYIALVLPYVQQY